MNLYNFNVRASQESVLGNLARVSFLTDAFLPDRTQLEALLGQPNLSELLLVQKQYPKAVQDLKEGIQIRFKDGTSLFYITHSNATIQEIGLLDEQGFRQGTWTTFFADGMKETQVAYQSGQKQGVFKRFYPSGSLQIFGEFDQDKRLSDFLYFKPNGVQSSGAYDLSGKREGEWHTYDVAGRVVKTKTFEQGRLVYHKTYFKNGREKSLVKYNSQGEIIYQNNFYSNGNLKESIEYDSGKALYRYEKYKNNPNLLMIQGSLIWDAGRQKFVKTEKWESRILHHQKQWTISSISRVSDHDSENHLSKVYRIEGQLKDVSRKVSLAHLISNHVVSIPSHRMTQGIKNLIKDLELDFLTQEHRQVIYDWIRLGAFEYFDSWPAGGAESSHKIKQVEWMAQIIEFFHLTGQTELFRLKHLGIYFGRLMRTYDLDDLSEVEQAHQKILFEMMKDNVFPPNFMGNWMHSIKESSRVLSELMLRLSSPASVSVLSDDEVSPSSLLSQEEITALLAPEQSEVFQTESEENQLFLDF